MKRFRITEAEYEAIKAKEAKTKDKNISRRLRVLMLRYEGKKLDEITKMTKSAQNQYHANVSPLSGAGTGRIYKE